MFNFPFKIVFKQSCLLALTRHLYKIKKRTFICITYESCCKLYPLETRNWQWNFMIRMKLTSICENWKVLSHGQCVQKFNGKIFCFKNKFLNFSKTKKFSTESFLTFRELQPLVSYKRVPYKKIRVFNIFLTLFLHTSSYSLKSNTCGSMFDFNFSNRILMLLLMS